MITDEERKIADAVIDDLQKQGMYSHDINHEKRFRIALERIAKGDLDAYTMTVIARSAEAAAEMIDGAVLNDKPG